jgi:hypothetical protein
MGGLVEKSLDIAAKKFQKFGFSDIQIEQLLSSAKRDLEGEVLKLEELLEMHKPDIGEINHTLHAIKGLLYNMGHTEAGDQMAELKDDDSVQKKIEKIRKVLNSG